MPFYLFTCIYLFIYLSIYLFIFIYCVIMEKIKPKHEHSFIVLVILPFSRRSILFVVDFSFIGTLICLTVFVELSCLVLLCFLSGIVVLIINLTSGEYSVLISLMISVAMSAMRAT